jgi:ubiquitin C
MLGFAVRQMKIHVKRMMTPPTCTLDVESSDTIGSVMAQIRDVPLHMQLLIFANQLLQDDGTLADYNIQDGDSIHFVIDLK